MKEMDMISLMNDKNMVMRYSSHLNKIFFKHSDSFLREKFGRYL